MVRIVIAGVILLSSSGCFAQDARPAFEVADVQISKAPPEQRPHGRLNNSRVDVTNARLKSLIAAAYSVPEDDVTGGPSWLGTDRFDIVAKAPPNTPESALRLMLANLLAERFKLAFHKEERLKPAYALTVAKSGPKFHKSAAGEMENCGDADGDPSLENLNCVAISMAAFALFLPREAPHWIAVPVVDMTGLKGAYDFQLHFRSRPREAEAGKAGDPGISIFDALATLGLKLESRKLPLSVIVVDSINRTPTEN